MDLRQQRRWFCGAGGARWLACVASWGGAMGCNALLDNDARTLTADAGSSNAATLPSEGGGANAMGIGGSHPTATGGAHPGGAGGLTGGASARTGSSDGDTGGSSSSPGNEGGEGGDGAGPEGVAGSSDTPQNGGMAGIAVDDTVSLPDPCDVLPECTAGAEQTREVNCPCWGTKWQSQSCSSECQWSDAWTDETSCDLECCAEVVYCNTQAATDTSLHTQYPGRGTWCRRREDGGSCSNDEVFDDCLADIAVECGGITEEFWVDY